MRNVTRNARVEPLPFGTSRPKDHGSGRVCANESCSAILSRYNKGPCCYMHTPKAGYRVTTGAPLKRRKGTCPKHGVVHNTGVRHIV